MSIDSEQASANNIKPTTNNLSETSIERKIQNKSPEVSSEKKSDKDLSETSIEHKNETNLVESSNDTNHVDSEKNETMNESDSPKLIRFVSPSSKTSENNSSPKPSNTVVNERPPSPIHRHRAVKQQNSTLTYQQRARSNSPRKTFSYLSPDRFNLRMWKEQRRLLAKKEENDRIYHENRQKLERLARIAKEPSAYPTVHVEQERLRDRHINDYRRQVLKRYIPIMHENLYLVQRLANVKGVYDVKQMEDDFTRHTVILKQDAANRKKVRETATQRPFILPKVHNKS